MWALEVLGLTPEADEKAIKKAYAKQLKQPRPDEDPVGFQHLHEAYQAALTWRRDTPIEQSQTTSYRPTELFSDEDNNNPTSTAYPDTNEVEPPVTSQSIDFDFPSYYFACMKVANTGQAETLKTG